MRIVIIFVLLLSTPAFSWENIDNEFSNLNTDMRHMWSGGNWEHESSEGYLRLLVVGGGYEHYKSRLYIQWILHGSDMIAPKILKTVEVSELNENPLYAFNLPTCLGGWECKTLKLEATHIYELTEHIFTIKLLGIGKYEIKHKAL